MSDRPKLGFDDLDPTEFTPKAVGFRSREPKPAPQEGRGRKKTGRTVQINLKATQETVDTFLEVAQRNGWTQAVAFERAVDLLKNR